MFKKIFKSSEVPYTEVEEQSVFMLQEAFLSAAFLKMEESDFKNKISLWYTRSLNLIQPFTTRARNYENLYNCVLKLVPRFCGKNNMTSILESFNATFAGHVRKGLAWKLQSYTARCCCTALEWNCRKEGASRFQYYEEIRSKVYEQIKSNK